VATEETKAFMAREEQEEAREDERETAERDIFFDLEKEGDLQGSVSHDHVVSEVQSEWLLSFFSCFIWEYVCVSVLCLCACGVVKLAREDANLKTFGLSGLLTIGDSLPCSKCP